MVSRKEKERYTWLIMLLHGLFCTFDHWTRVLSPFIHWQLEPKPSLFDVLLLNSIGNCATLFGGLVIAQLIDSSGCRITALIVVCATAIYQMVISQVGNYYMFGFTQLLLMCNHLPMVADAMIARLVGADGDEKERANLIMRLNVPESVAYAVGPYLAIQALYLFSPSIHSSQLICGCIHLIIALPLIYTTVPSSGDDSHRSFVPSIETYKEMLNESKLRRALLFVVMVAAPYSAYEQVIRTTLASHMIFMPADMAKLALLLGVSTLAANIFLLPALQSRMGPQALLQLSMVTLTVSYLYLSQVKSYYLLLIGMPFQAVGISVAYGQLASQIMGNVHRSNIGKAAALNRCAQLASSAMAPLISGYYVDTDEANLLCYLSAFVSVLGIIAVYKYGSFMKTHFTILPLRTHDE